MYVCTCADRECVRALQTTGRCFCCDSSVRWPTALLVFRCTTCTTINDLRPIEKPSSAAGPKGDIYIVSDWGSKSFLG